MEESVNYECYISLIQFEFEKKKEGKRMEWRKRMKKVLKKFRMLFHIYFQFYLWLQSDERTRFVYQQIPVLQTVKCLSTSLQKCVIKKGKEKKTSVINR